MKYTALIVLNKRMMQSHQLLHAIQHGAIHNPQISIRKSLARPYRLLPAYRRHDLASHYQLDDRHPW